MPVNQRAVASTTSETVGASSLKPGLRAPQRRTPPATARREHPNHVASVAERALVRQPLRPFLSAGQQPVLARSSRLTTGQTPWTRNPSLRDERRRAVLEDLEVAFDPIAAANATIVEVPASHVSFVSQPEAATQLILQAVEATAAAPQLPL